MRLTLNIAAISLTVLTSSILMTPRPTMAQQNDNFFAPIGSARHVIKFDGKGFTIRGKRVFIAAGDFHYSRMPRALWRERLLMIKRAGYNTVQTYTFWNFHEKHEGKFDFSGDKDLGAYLQTIQDLGMYAIVRVGPYVNAEWESGGWPVWLRFKPGLLVREDNPKFLFYMDRWLDHLIPIVAKHQISNGGNVIAVQLENEDPRGAGTDLPNSYFVHLRNKVLSLGINVPHFFSGLNHSDNPAGDYLMDTSKRTSPWYSTEFWTGWIATYGADAGREQKLDRATWNVLANGGAGFTHYTIEGGSDFANWACDQQAASYDFGAPIGQAGDLRDIYYRLHRSVTFATTFSNILADAVDSAPTDMHVANGISVTSRTSPAGTIKFLLNQTYGAIQTKLDTPIGQQLPTSGTLNLAPREVIPILEHYQYGFGITLDACVARTLTILTQGKTRSIVVYGPPGDSGQLQFSGSAIVKSSKTSGVGVTLSPGRALVNFKFPSGAPQSYWVKLAGHTLRVLVLNTDQASRAWTVSGKYEPVLIVGPDYVGETKLVGSKLILETSRSSESSDSTKPRPCWYIDDATIAPLGDQPAAKAHRVPTLSPWVTVPATARAQPSHSTKTWFKSVEPQQMGADGDSSSYAWYRADVSVLTSGTYALELSDAGDWVDAFVDGNHVGSTSVQQRFRGAVPREIAIVLHTGVNHLALLASHYGREKLHAYIGSIETIDSKGIIGPVGVGSVFGKSINVTKWRWKTDDAGEATAGINASVGLDDSVSPWADYTIHQDVFNGRVGSAWFRSVLDDVPGPTRNVHFDNVDDNGTIYLNGKRLYYHEGYGSGFDVDLSSAWNEHGKNVLAVLVANINQGGGIFGNVTLSGRPAGSQRISDWRMKGGIGRTECETGKWTSARAISGQLPRFYKATFSISPFTPHSPHPIFRLTTDGMSRGYVWLNGHNLGRYPERSPVDGYYLPENWLRRMNNVVEILDEDGNSPAAARLVEEHAASRDNIVFAVKQPKH